LEKTINGIDIGLTVQQDVYAAIDYRWEPSKAFITSPWVKVNRYGQAFFHQAGIEFRVRIKILTYEDIELDYTNVRVLYDTLKPIGMMSQ
jgi:hypothetical protein